jgi:glycosyltransferase involved in cell wall biosynthesis
VLPEDQSRALEAFAIRPQRKVVYCQNHFYAAMIMTDSRTYADFGVSHILCSGQTIHDYCRHRHPGVPAHVIPIGVDPQKFYPRPKQERITFMPRERPVEAAYIRDLFRFDYPQFRDIPWLELSNKSESEIAEALGGSSVFLVLHRLDSLPLTGLEAMASGCVVAGFTGIGGREYARPENGFWAEEDDFPTCVRQLAEAVLLSRETGPRHEAYASACAQMASRYTPATFEEAVRVAWAEILRN